MSKEVAKTESYDLSRTETVFHIPIPPPVNQEYRMFITELTNYIMSLDNSVGERGLSVDHSFCNGLYMRTMYAPKGTFIVGKFHKDSYTSVLLKGDISVVTEAGALRMAGPATTVAPAGMKRMGYCHEDTVWMTIHPNPDNLTDVREVEDRLFLDGYAELPPFTEVTPSEKTISLYNWLCEDIQEIEAKQLSLEEGK